MSRAFPYRHHDAVDPACLADWFVARFDELVESPDRLPLLVAVTVTFALSRVRPDRVLIEFERFYARLCKMLVNNYERPSKRSLLPIGFAWRDDPRTRPDKWRSRPSCFYDHPAVAPHVHALLIVRPALVTRFREVEPQLASVWRSIPQHLSDAAAYLCEDRPICDLDFLNRTLQVEREMGERVSRDLAGSDESTRARARAELARWVAYSAKLGERWDAGEDDLFTVLPPLPTVPASRLPPTRPLLDQLRGAE